MIDFRLAAYYFRDKFWDIVHNCISHPLLPFFGETADRFHDWTIAKWNPSEEPVKDLEIVAINRLLATQEGRERVARLLSEASE